MRSRPLLKWELSVCAAFEWCTISEYLICDREIEKEKKNQLIRAKNNSKVVWHMIYRKDSIHNDGDAKKKQKRNKIQFIKLKLKVEEKKKKKCYQFQN